MDGDLLGRYLAGECTAAEAAVVRRYFMTHPDAIRALNEYLGQLDAGASRIESPDAMQSFATLRQRMHAADASAELAGEHDAPATLDRDRTGTGPSRAMRITGSFRTPSVERRRNRFTTVAFAIAAAAAAAIVVMTFDVRRVNEVVVPHTYTTTQGQQADLDLADGTHVRIAPGSQLRIATDFGRDRRDVYLRGEAYFDVVHDAHRPFTVFAGNASAHDLGTAFSVRSYVEDSAVKVVVRKGAVALSGVGRLGAGDVGRLGAEGNASVQRHVDVDAMLDWMNGRLVFADAPLNKVLRDVGRWYGVDVQLADSSLAALPFTGTLNNLSPTAAVDMVAHTLGLRVRHDDTHLILDAVPGRTRGVARRHRVSPS